MARIDDPTAFVKEALAHGVPRAAIRDVLLQVGWSMRQVSDALASFADVPFAIPVPTPRRYTDAREAFLYALLFLALTLSAYHLGVLLFQFIEQAFPLTNDARPLREVTRWPIAVLVVAVPVLVYVSRLVNREVRLDPSRRTSKSRTQMTYITLFVCTAVAIGVLAGVVYNFLGGEVTARFILKALTAFGIAGGIFGYYLRDMRTDPTRTAVRAMRDD